MFNRISAALLFASGIPTIAAAQENCRAIQDAKARLDCFDKMPATPPPAPAKKAAPPAARGKAEPGTTTDSGWQLRKSRDAMSDKVTCVIMPIAKPYIQFNIGDFYLSYAGRGGVEGFQYRIDDNPASGMQIPSPIEKQISAVHLSGRVFEQILKAKRLRVSTLTLIRGLQDEDIDLAPMRRLYARMVSECSK